jgi:hypothetical protein
VAVLSKAKRAGCVNFIFERLFVLLEMLETIKTVGCKVGRNEYIERHLVTYILHKTELYRSGRVP